jgi:hypothetical protein
MNFITGFNRNQTVLVSQSYDQLIAEDNVVPFVDLFTEALNVVDFGFRDVSHHVIHYFIFRYFYPKYENVGWFLDGLPLCPTKKEK